MAKPPAIIEPHEDGFSWRQYWTFYWPLTLTAFAMIFSRQFQNGTLGRFEDSSRELAIYSFASSSFQLFNAVLIFIPQMVNALGRSAADRRICKRFVTLITVAATGPVILLAFTAPGARLIGSIFHVEGRTLDETTHYLRLMAALIPLTAIRQYCLGMLIQARRTGLATVINIVSTVIVIAVLATGLHRRWSAVATLTAGLLAAMAVTAAASMILCRRFAPHEQPSGDALTLSAMWHYFWPVALTSVMFALSRPMIFSFVNRTADGVESVAALRVAMDLAMLFQNKINQFRHVFVTFGRTHMTQLRRFVMLVTACLSLLMLAMALTPAGLWFFRDVIGADGKVPQLARQCFIVMCLGPVILATRNYYHGLAMVYGRTVSMAAGAVSRVVAIYAICSALLWTGTMNHLTAAGVLMAGFLAETLAVIKYAPKHEPDETDDA